MYVLTACLVDCFHPCMHSDDNSATETQSRLLSKISLNLDDTEGFESETHETVIVDPES